MVSALLSNIQFQSFFNDKKTCIQLFRNCRQTRIYELYLKRNKIFQNPIPTQVLLLPTLKASDISMQKIEFQKHNTRSGSEFHQEKQEKAVLLPPSLSSKIFEQSVQLCIEPNNWNHLSTVYRRRRRRRNASKGRPLWQGMYQHYRINSSKLVNRKTRIDRKSKAHVEFK